MHSTSSCSKISHLFRLSSCLQALENKNLHHPVIRDIIQILTYLDEVGSTIEFCWIPGHVGIKGNEQADRTARRIINHPVHDTKLPFSDFKPCISKYVNKLFQTKWDNCSTNKLHEINDTFLPSLKIYSKSRKRRCYFDSFENWSFSLNT